MEKDEAGAFEFFKPLFSVLISDAERQVRENAALSLEDWANTHPEEVAQWCCHLAEAEARSYTGPFSSMAGYHIRLAFSRLVAGRPDQAVVVLDCIQGYPDRYDLNQIVLEVKSLPTQCRGQIRPILERLLKEGLPAAQEVLDSWQSEPADDVDASNGGQST
jgi:hypothetical protein